MLLFYLWLKESSSGITTALPPICEIIAVHSNIQDAHCKDDWVEVMPIKLSVLLTHTAQTPSL